MTKFETMDNMNTNFVALSDQELMEMEGGSWELAAVGGVGQLIYQVVEAAGKTLYYVTHPVKRQQHKQIRAG